MAIYKRIKKRFKGWRKLKDQDFGMVAFKDSYVFDPVLPKVNNYIRKHYKWVISTLIAIIGILVAILVVPWSIQLQSTIQTDQPAKQTATKTYYYVPKTKPEDLNSLPVGSCWESIASNRYDAWRCTNESLIRDPCFSDSTQTFVACPTGPYSSEKLLKLTIVEKRFLQDSNKSQIVAAPWFVVLSEGANCSYLTGATDTVADGRIDYGCDNKTRYLSLPMDVKQENYNIKCYDPDNVRIDMCGIKEVWF